MSLESYFDEAMYAWMNESSARSAEVIVPMLLDLVRPRSVVDVGCGLGAWLAVYRKCGVVDVLGIDGPHVDPARLVIPRECFLAMDLRKGMTVPRNFDLAQSLEVAHYLPLELARGFVRFLTDLAPVVVFSSAVPGQPGQCVRNAQWPAYWRNLFAEAGCVALDPIRPRIWHDERVALHYRQNLLMFVRKQALESGTHPALAALPRANCLTLVDEDVLTLNLGARASFRRLLRWAWMKAGRA